MEKARTVRQRVLVQGVSERQVAREMGIGRNTVRRYVDGAEPGVRRPAARAAPILEKVRARMAEILAESPGWTTRKQRLTAFRLHEMLLEDGHSVGYTTVKSFVWEWRRERAEVFVPLEYRAGDLAEVDFFEVTVDEGGVRRKAFKFLMRLMYSGCARSAAGVRWIIAIFCRNWRENRTRCGRWPIVSCTTWANRGRQSGADSLPRSVKFLLPDCSPNSCAEWSSWEHR